MTVVLTTTSQQRDVGLPRLLAGLGPGPASLIEHEAAYGPLPLGWRPRRLIDTVERSGLVGRGGAGSRPGASSGRSLPGGGPPS